VKRFLPAVLIALATACTSGPPPPVDELPYEEQLRADRAAKDQYLLTDRQSPLLPEDRASFSGLPYYPIDPGMRVPARLREEKADPPVIIALPTSQQTFDRMRRVGTLAFTIAGSPYSLIAFTDADTRTITRLFVPFGDLTSGLETYQGGRYLDLDRTASGTYDLDFNRAYHPNCVYNAGWVCPVPPRENRLQVAIRAGERLPRQ
jgi:uncharacterized protein (DUF1684 family)